jgi:gluconokinase
MLRISPDVIMVHLEADPGLIEKRLKHRTGHFMNPVLVQSQFETLEEPEGALQINAGLAPAEIVCAIRFRLAL